MEEIKAERDRITLENVRLDNQLERLASETEHSLAKLRESQDTIAVTRNQVSLRISACSLSKLYQLSLDINLT